MEDFPIRGGIWRTAPVEDEPVITLENWRIFRVPSPTGDDFDDHFNGYSMGQGFWSGEGRVSSKIVEWDSENMIGITRSGRKYQLIGPPGYNGDANYVYGRWLNINKIDKDDVIDITGDYLNDEQKKALNGLSGDGQ